MALLALGSKLSAQSAREMGPGPGQPAVRLFPNPATSFIQVEWKNQSKPANLQIFNGATGKRMLTIAINSNEPLRINLNEYSRGLYIFHLYNSNGNLLEVGKFQVAR